jgi:ribosomal protein L32
MQISSACKRNEKKKQTKKQGEPSGAENVGDDGQGSSTQYQHVRDPIKTTTKGRPEEKRTKSGLHLKASKPVKCKACGSAQRPSKISTVPEPKEINFFRDMI